MENSDTYTVLYDYYEDTDVIKPQEASKLPETAKPPVPPADETSDYGMLVVLTSENGIMKNLWLPEKGDGKFTFPEDDGEKTDFVYCEKHHGTWYATCRPPASFSGRALSSVEIINKYQFMIDNNGSKYVLYAESLNAHSSIYHNYMLNTSGEITIGRVPENDICCPNNLVSRSHAVLTYTNGCWNIYDTNSLNGVFVNGRKVTQSALVPGDTIYIVGLRIVIGFGFISMNDGNERINVNPQKLSLVSGADDVHSLHDPGNSVRDDMLFNRLPRRREAMNADPIVVEGPPMAVTGNKIPLLLRMSTPAVMGTNALIGGNLSMLLTSFMFPIMTQRFTEKDRKEYSERRTYKYQEYLLQKADEIRNEKYREEAVLNSNYPPLNDVLSYPQTGQKLWERRKNDDDFLSVRVGTGERPLQAELSYPEKRFDMDDDPLEQQMYNLVESPVVLQQIPVMTSFTEDFVSGIIGDAYQKMLFARQLIIRMSVLYSYDELKMIFLIDEKDMADMDFVRFLPHTWDDAKTVRFLASNTVEAYKISEYLKGELEEDLKQNNELKKIMKKRPYYIVWAFSKRIFDSM